MLLICLLSSLAVASAQHSSTPTSIQSTLEQFKHVVRTQVAGLWTKVDTDHDHHFTADDMHHILDDYDSDHDHSVSMDEFVNSFAHNQPELRTIAKGLFYEFDMNHDGQIVNTDLDLYYQKIDTNDNGSVEKEEFVHYFTEIFTLLYIIQLNQQASSTPAPVGK